MVAKLLLGGLLGVVIGAATGWLVFNSITSATGIGCSIAASICGALIGLAPEDSKPKMFRRRDN